MAKRKRAPHEKPFSRPFQKPESDTAVAVAPGSEPSHSEEVAAPFVGKWNQLISTTNWEKGKIICEWRDALMASEAAVTEYSDEAWVQWVGGVTSQHVGRLRRVSQRFGDVADQYAGLFWSHFQAALDWDDAEMWLEGSIQNGWSVSQMRGKRWETVGTTAEEQQAEVAQLAAEQVAQLAAEQNEEAQFESNQAESAAQDIGSASERTSIDSAPYDSASEPNSEDPTTGESASADGDPTQERLEKRVRLSVDVDSLPDDLAEAFESFKLAIIAHRRENWRDTTPESVVECLDSLKQLALASAE
jgi:hypothetical protein